MNAKSRQFFTLLFAPVFTSFTSKEYDTTRFLTNNLFFSNLIMSQVCVNISNLNIIWGSNNATIISIARIDSKECWILLCYLFERYFLVVENYAVVLSRIHFRAYFECHTSLLWCYLCSYYRDASWFVPQNQSQCKCYVFICYKLNL